jgi:hypothetical protein
MPDQSQQPDIGKALLMEMVKNMAVLAKSNELLAQKVEDLTAALDDNRERLDGLVDIVDESAGYLGASLKVMEELGNIGSKNDDGTVKWSDVRTIIRDIKKAADEAEDGEEEEEEESAEEEEEEVER